jgi:hypothetical protein
MDAQTFDRWTAAFAGRPTRRGIVRLLAVGAVAGLVSPRLTRAAMQADRDGDGLFDDDETGVYGTNPDVFDSDGDGSSDGEEVYFGTDPLTAGGNVARADSDGDGLYDDDETNIYGTTATAADSDGDGVGDGEEVSQGTDPLVNANAAPAAEQAPDPVLIECRAAGAGCDSDLQCCAGTLCCLDGTTLTTRCTDVTDTGFVCYGDTPVPAGGCGAGLVDCGDGQGCVNVASNFAHCGACGTTCGLNQHCASGVCVGVSCFDGTVDCGVGHCVDLQTDFGHCGACGHTCPEETKCAGGVCAGAPMSGGGGEGPPTCDLEYKDEFGEPPIAPSTCEGFE